MAHLFLQPTHISIDFDDTFWIPLIFGHERADGMWEAWIEFRPIDERPLRITDRETTQPSRDALEYWAGGLEPVYFEGAFGRARASAA